MITRKLVMELLLATAAATCLGWYAVVHVEAAQAAVEASRFGAQASRHSSERTAGEGTIAAASTGSKVIGSLRILPLKLTVPIMADYQAENLLRGIGHVPGTAMPGGLGTMGLAGHRDTYFRPLKDIRKNMDIQVSDQNGTFHYQVDSTEIVLPADVNVLAVGDRPGLTLITCYPFYYVGSAPKRFIVHAHLVSVVPD